MVDPPSRAPRRGYAIASLVLGILSLPTAGLLLVGAVVAVVLGVIGLVKADREPDEYGGKGIAITGIVLAALSIVLLPVVGIVAAIAIPSLLRARISANEAAALADVRQLVAAERQYQQGNAGYFDTPSCLAAPDTCNPRMGRTALLDGTLDSSDTRHGYRRRFYPGPAAGAARPPEASRSSLSAYAFVAFPAVPERTGVRSFCGDSRGSLCYVASVRDLVIAEGACPPACKPVD
jgi:Domain of unknown function (DUF4190)